VLGIGDGLLTGPGCDSRIGPSRATGATCNVTACSTSVSCTPFSICTAAAEAVEGPFSPVCCVHSISEQRAARFRDPKPALGRGDRSASEGRVRRVASR